MSSVLFNHQTKTMKNVSKFLKTFVSIALFYIAVFAILLPWFCQNLPYSKYFTSERNSISIVKKAIEQNDQRLLEARAFLNDFDFNRFKLKDDNDNSNDLMMTTLDLVIGVITMNRETKTTGQLGYLTQTISRLLSIVSTDRSEDFKSKILFICNIESIPDNHDEAMKLSTEFLVFSRFENRTKNFDELNRNEDVFEKEKDDYVFCLKQAEKFLSNYILMIEDDVLLNVDSLFTLNHLLRTQILNDDNNAGVATDQLLYAKLYFPLKWQGYGNEADKIIELFGIAITSGSFVTIVSYLFSKLFHNRCANQSIYLSFTIAAATSVVMAMMIGRPYVRSWRSLSPFFHRAIDGPECCTQATLYPSSVIDDLVVYLSDLTCSIDFSIDLAISEFGKVNKMSRFLVDPNVCQHIGMISTVRSYAKLAAEFLD